MAGILQHAGYLNDESKVSQPAVAAFLAHRNAIINGEADSIFPESEFINPPTPVINLEDKQKFPTFFEKWTNILETSLNVLNLESTISVPFFDPTALATKLDLKSPAFSFEALLGMLFTQAGVGPVGAPILALTSLNVEPQEIQNLIAKINTEIIRLPLPPNPLDFIPAIPSPSFPTLNYSIPILNLKDKQIAIYTELPKIAFNLLAEFSKPENISNFALKGPAAIFDLSYTALKQGFPRPPGINNTSNDVNIEALVRTLTKPMAIVPIGLTVGSSYAGITGNIGAQSPDSMREIEQPTRASDRSIIIAGSRVDNNLLINTDVSFRKKLVEVADGLGINPDYLAVTMAIETADTFLPNIRSGEAKKVKSGIPAVNWTDPEQPFAILPNLPNGWIGAASSPTWAIDRFDVEQIAIRVQADTSLEIGEGLYEIVNNTRYLFRVEVHFDNHSDGKLHWHRGITVHYKADPTAPDPFLQPVTDKTKTAAIPPGSTNKQYKGNAGPAVGLIQFTSAYKVKKNGKDVIQKGAIEAINDRYGTSYTKEILSNMTAVEQLGVVQQYFELAMSTYGFSGSELNDLGPEAVYLMVFLPSAAKLLKSNSEILSTQPEFVSANPGYVVTKNGKTYLSRGKLTGIVRNKLSTSITFGRVYAEEQSVVPESGTLSRNA